MNIEIPSELVAKLKQPLKTSKFQTTEELIKYLLEQYLVFYDNDDDMIEFIETYTETYHEMKETITIDTETYNFNSDFETRFPISYEIENSIDYE